MSDRIVRAAFHRKVLNKAHQCSDTFVVDELSLRNGFVRADIAVLNGKLIGYEIKTEKDNLNRFANQVAVYNEVFDKAYVIVSEKHLNKTLEIIPHWWGIYIIKPTENENIHFRCLRRGKLNKVKSSLAIAQFLWKSEVIEVLQAKSDISIKNTATKKVLYDELAKCSDPKTLGDIALNYLKNRKDWRIGR